MSCQLPISRPLPGKLELPGSTMHMLLIVQLILMFTSQCLAKNVTRHPLVLGDEKIRELRSTRSRGRVPIVINKPKSQTDNFQATILNVCFNFFYLLTFCNFSPTDQWREYRFPQFCPNNQGMCISYLLFSKNLILLKNIGNIIILNRSFPPLSESPIGSRTWLQSILFL